MGIKIHFFAEIKLYLAMISQWHHSMSKGTQLLIPYLGFNIRS